VRFGMVVGCARPALSVARATPVPFAAARRTGYLYRRMGRPNCDFVRYLAEHTGGFGGWFGEIRPVQHARVVIRPSPDGGTLTPLVSPGGDHDDGETS
jgi:hypothetical protein